MMNGHEALRSKNPPAFRRGSVNNSEAEVLVEGVISSVPGMTGKSECLWLYEMAKRCSKGVVVEIGSSAGRSTICLALGSKAGNRVEVYAVDPFNGGGATPDPTWWDMSHEGTPNPKYYINQGASFQPFWDNIRKFEVKGVVRPLINYSELAVQDYPNKPIELLFIDGDHRYNYVKLDVKLWGAFLIPGGTIALHDSNFTGVRRIINEEIIGSGRYEDINEFPVFHARKVEDKAWF